MPIAYSDPSFLSTLPVNPRQQRLAAVVVLLSLALVAVLAPLAARPLPQVWAFIPIYETWLICNDTVTVVLLLSQYRSFGSRAIYVLACGYLYSAVMTVFHALSFPDLFAPGGWIGAGPQTTAWIYMGWHAGFPLFAAAYSLLRDAEVMANGDDRPARTAGPAQPARRVLPWPLALGALGPVAVVLLCTLDKSALPSLMVGSHYTPVMIVVVSCVWLSAVAALLVVARRRMRSLLDLWLSVVLFAWVIDIALSAVLNMGRFDLGFYAGRIYGLMASSIVLVILLLESGALYVRLMEMTRTLQRLITEDALTGLSNRRFFDISLETEWRRARRAAEPLSLLMIDVDHFKRYNDRYGHVAGDSCLQSVAMTLRQGAGRAGDVVARYGGEEFAVLLPATGAQEALASAQRLAERVRSLALDHADSPTAACVTISVGVVTAFPGASRDTQQDPRQQAYEELVSVADRALYAAKAAGRNQARMG
ncbi:MAG: GGDEF domain-containing protein [Paucibacter sp.]|nr:GGDEF domain-containing protein [Roseateles sp.]